jgi:hypothetical protein
MLPSFFDEEVKTKMATSPLKKNVGQPKGKPKKFMIVVPVGRNAVKKPDKQSPAK